MIDPEDIEDIKERGQDVGVMPWERSISRVVVALVEQAKLEAKPEPVDTAELNHFLSEVARLVQDSETLMNAVGAMHPYVPTFAKASSKMATDSLRITVDRVAYMRKQLREKINGEADGR